MQSSRSTGARVVNAAGQPSRLPGLSFQPGDWVKLKRDLPGDIFKDGDLVKIYDIEEEPKSETEREGQLSGWTRTDADTLYRFLKMEWVTNDKTVATATTGPNIVPHAALASTPGGTPAPQAYPDNSLVYTRRKLSIVVGTRDEMDIPVGTRGLIVGLTTRVSGRLKVGQGAPLDPSKCNYIVEFKLREYHLRETKCSLKKECGNFDKIGADQRNAHLAYISKPPRARHFMHYPA
ncbi:hypothetical protein FKP32DRAFT_1588536 [Trametes sanguinea]|nr:hypothetical protein FKP32DRAFT_1588536 [Trametes sanguinea]